MGDARAQKATKGDMAAASSRNAARQPRGPATNSPNMYPCQTTRGSVTLAAVAIIQYVVVISVGSTRCSCQTRQGAFADKLQVQAAKILTLVGLARSQPDPINYRHILSIVPFQGEGESSLQEDALERILQVDRLKGMLGGC